MRVGFDESVLRHPPAGTARYVVELRDAMVAQDGPDTVVPLDGWRRVRRGGRSRRLANLASDLGWLTVGAAAAAARHGVDGWFGPANVLPIGLPRPKVVSILDANVFRVADAYDPAFVAYAARMYRAAAGRAATILTLSEDARQRLIEDLPAEPARIVVAYPGIEHGLRIAPGDRPAEVDGPYALFVGQSEPHKNLVRLVDAWALVTQPDLDLVIAGPAGRAEPDLATAIAGSPARHRIRRLGRVPDDTLARLYADATCFVFPSLSEGFGFPPLEAMARGVPTAVADASSLPEVTAGAALLFDPFDPEAIAATVDRLVDDAALRARLRTDGPAIAARYRWHATAATAWAAVRTAVAG